MRSADGQPYGIDLAQDARIRVPVRFDIGSVIADEELAADKVLALFNRASARDLIDVHALRQRFTDGALLALAYERDHGFDVGAFAQALGVASRRDDGQFVALGVAGGALDGLRKDARSWAEILGPA